MKKVAKIFLTLGFFCLTLFIFVPSSFAFGSFQASNVILNPDTWDLRFTASNISEGVGSLKVNYAGLADCNNNDSLPYGCVDSFHELWGFYSLNPVTDPENVNTNISPSISNNPYRPQNGTVYVWIRIYDQNNNSFDTLYSQALSYSSILQSGSDFTLNVPLLKQTDINWGQQTYDSANKWAALHPTIGDWGCALTSATMVLKYYKVDKLPNGTMLDPGSLNSWLKSQPDGYVGNGLLNWLAISRMTKQAKPQNPNFSYDALEYRRKNGYDSVLLTNDLQSHQPDILEEPGHFVVGKGTDHTKFLINDPYFSRNDLNNSAYNNSFISLGRYIPSHTDLSYLMFTVSPDFDITFTNSSGQKAGGDINNPFTDIPDSSYFLQNGFTDPATGDTSSSMKILIIPTPPNGNYTLSITSNISSPKKFSSDVYSYDTEGNVRTNTLSGIIKSDQPTTFTLPYENTPLNTRGNLTCDPSVLKGDNSTLHKLLCDVIHFFNP